MGRKKKTTVSILADWNAIQSLPKSDIVHLKGFLSNLTNFVDSNRRRSFSQIIDFYFVLQCKSKNQFQTKRFWN